VSGSGPYEDECEVRIEPDVSPYTIQVGPPFNPIPLGEPQPDAGFKMLLALIDGRRWPLHNCGDDSTGKNATPWGFMESELNRYTPIDGDSIPAYPLDPPNYPGVGVTAYGCEIDCNYLITGPLGAEGIIAKIDDQWHILRVTGSANTLPLTGPSNECRCCGGSRKNRIMRAEILRVDSGTGCQYPIGTQFTLDPITASNIRNPLRISISCEPQPDSAYEDIEDWSAFACGFPAEVLSIDCCAPYEGSGSGSGSGSGEACRFEAVIRTAIVEGCSTCSYDILIWDEVGSPCQLFRDEKFGEPVLMEACGLPNLKAGTRVIMARIPGGIPGRAALDGQDPIEWFVVRACTDAICAYPCDEEPPAGPPCCGKLCSEHPETVTATIEVIAGDIVCEEPVAITLVRTASDACDGAADVRWTLAAPIPDNTLCPGTTAEDPFYPTWLDIENMQLICGTAGDVCGGEYGSGSASGSGSGAGPNFGLTMGGGLETGALSATQDQDASCCTPLYLEFTITGMFAMVAGAGVINHTVTLRIIITE
jgi:hypothetical protein